MSSSWLARPQGGTRTPLRLLQWFAERCGRTPARLLLYPLASYYYLRRGPERRASAAYLRRLHGRAPRRREVLAHMHCFAAVVLDRLYLLRGAGRGFDIDVHGLETLRAALDRGRGVLLLGAHVGSFEALRVLSTRCPDRDLHIVLDRRHGAAITELLERVAPELAARVIDGGGDAASVVLALSEAIGRGNMVGLLADRGRPGQATCTVPFLGAPAPFPSGPWQLAAALGVPVMLCFGLYAGGCRYRLHFEPFADPLELPRRGREAALHACVARYAARIEEHLRELPYNWFNFYDFWQAPGPVPPR